MWMTCSSTLVYHLILVGWDLGRVAVENLSHSLEWVWDWMRANKLRRNPDKMEVLFVGRDVQLRIL